MKTRADALNLLHEYTAGESLRKHAYAVEASMRAYAAHYGEDVEKWSVTGLLHDFDYEKYPTPAEHTIVGTRILREQGYPEDIIRAIQGHADYNGIQRETRMEKALYACDELSGFVMAVAMVRPNRRLDEVEVRSVRKKLKDKAFARGVNRDDVVRGAEEMGLDLDEHIAFVIGALTRVAPELGLEDGQGA